MKKQLDKYGKVVKNPLLKDYTTYKIGVPALYLVIPKNIENLKKLLIYLKKENVKYKIIGKGSNLIFDDKGFDGIIIKLDELDNLKINRNIVTVGSGYNMMRLANKITKTGLTGLEFAAGIPGTVGGCVFMNAGAYNSDMGYVVKSVTVLDDDLNIKILTNKEMNFHYRTSLLKENPSYICLEATFKLSIGNKKEMLDIIKDRKERRMLSQPLEYPSAGSVFRNPYNHYAGKLIEDIGYKGKKYGDMEVSLKHANFIVNKGKGSSKDLIRLIDEIQSKVKKQNNIDLLLEQEIVKF